MTPPTQDDAGSITPMMIAFTLGLLLVISAVIDVSGSYLRRQSVTSLADGASLAAANKAASVAVYGDTDAEFVSFDEAAARAAVADYLRSVDALRSFPGLRADVGVDGHTITVELTTRYSLPVHVPGTPHTIDVSSTSAAEMPIY